MPFQTGNDAIARLIEGKRNRYVVISPEFWELPLH
jgi:hypothetical protein